MYGRETFVYRDQYHIGLAFTAQKGFITSIGIVGSE